MANTHTASQIVTNEVLRIAHNASAFVGNVNTDHDDKWSGQYSPGQTIQARGPVQFSTRDGEVVSVQDVTEWSTPVTLQPLLGIDFALNLTDMVQSIGPNGVINERFRTRYLEPAGKKLAAILDFRLGTIMKNGFHQLVGTPGTGPSTVQHILDAQVPLDRMAVPRDGMRIAAIEPGANASVVAGLSTLFNSQSMLADQYKTGLLKTGLGLDFVMSQNVPVHTVGALGGTPLVNGANQGLINSGATDNPRALTTSLVTDGWTASAAPRLAKGDVFTIAGVFSVNPETKQSTGVLQDFVVTAAVSSDGSGNATVVISPAIIAGGAYQNVTARPADNAAITVRTGTASTAYVQNLIWHKDAVTLVSPEQSLPQGMAVAAKSALPDGGLSLRWVQGYDITNNRNVNRMDILWGASVVLPSFGVRRSG
mgnify:FL=1